MGLKILHLVFLLHFIFMFVELIDADNQTIQFCNAYEMSTCL